MTGETRLPTETAGQHAFHKQLTTGVPVIDTHTKAPAERVATRTYHALAVCTFERSEQAFAVGLLQQPNGARILHTCTQHRHMHTPTDQAHCDTNPTRTLVRANQVVVLVQS
jgi:hypothetical protein